MLGGGGKGGERGPAPAMITKARGGAPAKKAEVTGAEAKALTRDMLKKEEKREMKKGGKSGARGGAVSKMLADLNLAAKYAGKFAEAGVDDSTLADIKMMLKGDEDEKEEGRKGVEELISSTGLVGGSASRVRSYLVDGPKKVAPAKPAASAPPPTQQNKKPVPKKKKANDLSALDDTLGGDAKKGRGRRKK